MRVVLTGASGFIGSALAADLSRTGHEVIRLVRRAPQELDERSWDPSAGRLEPEALEGAQAVVHLAGEPVASHRWTAGQRQRIRDSRLSGTRVLADRLCALPSRPAVFLCASATGYYGGHGEEWLDERSGPGRGFLAETCQAWESACEPAARAGIRVVNLRIGMVLGMGGGALSKLLPPFRLGLGGRLGSGAQYMSWITMQDLLGAAGHVLADSRLQGPVNAVAPNPCTNRAFARALGRALRRPAVLPLPAGAVRLLFGEMGQEMLLSGARVKPARLLDAGYRFRDQEIEPALRRLLAHRSSEEAVTHE